MSATRTSPVQEHAERLRAAELERRPIPPLTETAPHLSVADAYAIQTHNVERRLAAGGRVVGRKVGLTSRAMQRMLGVEEPDFGALVADMEVPQGDAVALDALIAPRAEAEIAFLLAEDLPGPGVTATSAMRAVAGALPAIEIIDSRVADWRIKLVDTVADNASSARFTVGAKLTPLTALDLRLEGMVLSRGGETIDTGAGAGVLGNPLRCLAWPANTLTALGHGLRAGDIVLAGALHAAVPVAHGDVLRAEFTHLGAVTARFTEGEER